jgi:uncharacterized small protein (DUF1192 family)
MHYPQPTQEGSNSARAMIAGQMQVSSRELTVAQNIDNRIAGLREQIARLEQVKAKLSRGTILDVSLEDLQMAMGRY